MITTDEGVNHDSEMFMAPMVALNLAQTLPGDLLVVFDDAVLHNFKEKAVFEGASQPTAPTKVLHELMENTGSFPNRTVTTLVNFDSDSTSMMTKVDETNLEKDLDSIADYILTFTTEGCKLTQPFLPQLGLKVNPSRNLFWTSAYL